MRKGKGTDRITITEQVYIEGADVTLEPGDVISIREVKTEFRNLQFWQQAFRAEVRSKKFRNVDDMIEYFVDTIEEAFEDGRIVNSFHEIVGDAGELLRTVAYMMYDVIKENNFDDMGSEYEYIYRTFTNEVLKRKTITSFNKLIAGTVIDALSQVYRFPNAY